MRVGPFPPVLGFSAEMKATATVASGATLEFETLDACGGAISGEEDIIRLDDVDDPAKFTGGNPAAGPVALSGAEPGDTLVVRILKITPAARGLACAFPGVGPLSRRISSERTWFLDLDDGVARRGDLVVPLRPMIGVIGVATCGPRVGNDFPGPHGGNLDDRHITEGSTVYLPVCQAGAMLALGDVHAAMGDGELTGSGLEVSARVTVQVDLIRGRRPGWPIVETDDAWYTHGAAAEWADAVDIACEESASLLESEWSLPAEEIPLYLTLAGDLGVCQACQPSPFPAVARMGVRKSPTAPRPFRWEGRPW